jgi:hypothetical protein
MTHTPESPNGTPSKNPANPSGGTDIFADIATKLPVDGRGGIEEPVEPGCPDRILPLSQPGEGAAPKRLRARKIETPAQLHAALAELRESTRPFLSNLAPALPDTRQRFAIDRFQWRIGTDEDCFAQSLEGVGQWEEVKIPHYGPPLGPASTLYRTTFDFPPEMLACERLVLCFGAVDYRCQVYLNGMCLGVHEGFFEAFEFDATRAACACGNVLLIRVENDHTMLGEAFNDHPADGDKIYAATGLGYDDPQEGWHHCPPAMGIWQPVWFEGRARMVVADLFVRPLPDLDAVEIHVEIEKSGGKSEEETSLLVSIYGQNFAARVHENHAHRGEGLWERGFGDLDHGIQGTNPSVMGAGRNYLSLTLPMPDARIWDLDAPWLYQAQVRLLDEEGRLLDAVAGQFGMRTFTQDEDSSPKGKFRLNGREIRLRGANTMGHLDQCVFQGNFDQLRDDILLAKLTNLNFLRLTQHPAQKEVYEYCDRLGLLLQTDLPLFATIRRNQFLECARQAAAMERHVRSHPSSALISFINEPFPAARGKPHRFIDREDMEVFFEIATKLVHRENPGRVIKCVDGDYDPPNRMGMPDNHCYCGWYIGHGIDLGRLHHGGWMAVKPGWYFGCGEFGSEGVDSFGVMQEFYPEAWMPPSLDAPWDPGVIPQSQTRNFHRLWYPSPGTAGEWIEASQRHQEWITRLMTESFRRKAGMNTFAIHLFIDAWPAGWMKAIMDVNRVPKKAWFAYRDALAPLAVSLRTDRTAGFSGETVPVEIWVCNDRDESPEGLSVAYEIMHEGACIASGAVPVITSPCAPAAQGRLEVVLPEVRQRGIVHVGATLIDKDGEALHDSEISLGLFPSPAAMPGNIHMPGSFRGADDMPSHLGQKPEGTTLEEAGVILIADVADYAVRREEVDDAVLRGATAVLLQLPAGAHRIGRFDVEVLKAGMGPRHFVNCSTGHPMVAGFSPDDFKFWFDERKGFVSPILETVLRPAKNWTPILETGDGGWGQAWGPVPAVAECADGRGMWRICQVDLLHRIKTNPVASIFAARLLQPHRSTAQPTQHAESRKQQNHVYL